MIGVRMTVLWRTSLAGYPVHTLLSRLDLKKFPRIFAENIDQRE